MVTSIARTMDEPRNWLLCVHPRDCNHELYEDESHTSSSYHAVARMRARAPRVGRGSARRWCLYSYSVFLV